MSKQGRAKTSSSARDKIRSVTVGASKKFETKIIEVEGVEIELRQPSIKLFRKIGQKATNESSGDGQTVDLIEMGIWSMIYCCYVPGTDEHVFDPEDYDEIMSRPKGGFIEHITSEIVMFLSINVEALAKNSEATDKDN